MGSAAGARERLDSRGRGGSRTKEKHGAPAWTWKGALAVLVIAVAIVVWNYSSPLPTSYGFDFTATPPRLILQPELTAQVRDFDAIFARLWASKSTHLKYAFDARTVTTRLVEVALPTSSTSEDDQPPAIINFAIQKVEGRRHRPINPVAELHEVVQPFTTDSGAFNFNNKDASEVLFTIDVVRSQPAHAEPQHAHDQEQQKGWTSELAGVLVNSHPFSYGCVVLVVRTDRMLPQVLTQEAIEVGLLLAAQSTEGLRVGYNSLAGGASVNHLHFQGWYFNATPDGQLPVESAPFALLRSSSGLAISQSQGYPIRSLLFSTHAEEDVSPSRLSAAVYSCVDHLLRHNIPHNLIFASGGRKAYVIPRRFATPNEWNQRAGFPEVAGQIVTVSEEAFAGLESPYQFLEALSLSREEFADVLAACC